MMPKTDTHGPNSLSMASEDYLESIYRIMKEQPEDDRSVRSVDVAEQLGVSKASVSKALSSLRQASSATNSTSGVFSAHSATVSRMEASMASGFL